MHKKLLFVPEFKNISLVLLHDYLPPKGVYSVFEIFRIYASGRHGRRIYLMQNSRATIPVLPTDKMFTGES